MVALQLSRGGGDRVRQGDTVRVAALLGLLLLPPVPSIAAQAGSPAGPVPVERLEARRAALLDSIGTGVAVLRSADVRSIEDDHPQDGDYREDNDFFYLTGLESPGGWLVLVARADSGDKAILYLSERDSSREKWSGTKLGPGPEATRLSGIEIVRPARAAEAEIQKLVFGSGSPARAGALYLRRGPREMESPFFQRLVFSDRTLGQPVRIADLSARTAQLRLIKDRDEVERLRRAIAITGDGLRAAMESRQARDARIPARGTARVRLPAGRRRAPGISLDRRQRSQFDHAALRPKPPADSAGRPRRDGRRRRIRVSDGGHHPHHPDLRPVQPPPACALRSCPRRPAGRDRFGRGQGSTSST